MTRADELLALAAKVEALTGPDRELGAAVMMLAGGYRDIFGDRNLFDRGNDGYWTLEGEGEYPALPDPTASLDAAMTLVPEARFSEEDFRIERWNSSGVHPEHVRASAWVAGAPRVYAATPALALTAASLKARAAMEGADGARA